MSSFVGYQVRVVMNNGISLEGVIVYVDNSLLKLQNVKSSDTSRGIVKELIIKGSDINDLSVVGKPDAPQNIQAVPSSNNKTSDVVSEKKSSPQEKKIMSYKDAIAKDTEISKPTKSEEVLLPQSENQEQLLLPPKSTITDPAIISISNPGPPRTVPPPFIPQQYPPNMHPQFPHHFPPSPLVMPQFNMMFHPSAPPPWMTMHHDPAILSANSQPQPSPLTRNPTPPQPQQPQPQPEPNKIETPVLPQPRQSASPGRHKSPGRKMRLSTRDSETFGEPLKKQVMEEFDFVGNNAKFNKAKEYSALFNEEPVQASPPSPSSIPRPSFSTDDGRKVMPITADQMRNVYELSNSSGMSLPQLVENAGRNTAQLALHVLKHHNKKPLDAKIVVLVGVGVKGAVGICAARHLVNHNMNVYICRSRAYHLHDEVTNQRKLYQSTTGILGTSKDLNKQGKEAQIGSLPVEPVDLIVDALVGCGLRGQLQGNTLILTQWANSNGAPIMSIETPTGLDASTGKSQGEAIRPYATLCLGLPKTGSSRDRVGKLYLSDIGVPNTVYSKVLGSQYVSPFVESFVMKLSM